MPICAAAISLTTIGEFDIPGRTENHFCNSGACTATRGNADSIGTVPFSRLAFACSSGNLDI
jgi:hypothetical protein